MTLEIHQERPNARPWLIAGAVVLTLHMGGVAALLVRFFDPPPLPAPPPAILIDMEPLPVPELPQEALPVPEELPPVDLKPPPPPPEPEVVPDPPKPVVPSKVEMAPPPEPPPPVIEREVAVPLPPPPPPPKPKPKPVVKPKVVTPPPPLENPLPPVVDAPPPEQAPPSSALVPQAPVQAPPPPPVVKTDRVVTWENRLYTKMQRFKRYPSRAELRRSTGRVEIRFMLDRDGNVVKRDITLSSGNPVLDKAALDTIDRASPFEPPPAEVPDSALVVDIPLDYTMPR